MSSAHKEAKHTWGTRTVPSPPKANALWMKNKTTTKSACLKNSTNSGCGHDLDTHQKRKFQLAIQLKLSQRKSSHMAKKTTPLLDNEIIHFTAMEQVTTKIIRFCETKLVLRYIVSVFLHRNNLGFCAWIPNRSLHCLTITFCRVS